MAEQAQRSGRALPVARLEQVQGQRLEAVRGGVGPPVGRAAGTGPGRRRIRWPTTPWPAGGRPPRRRPRAGTRPPSRRASPPVKRLTHDWNSRLVGASSADITSAPRHVRRFPGTARPPRSSRSPPVSRSASRRARPAGVLAAKTSATIRLGESSQCRMPATACVASTESPPRAKKSSSHAHGFGVAVQQLGDDVAQRPLQLRSRHLVPRRGVPGSLGHRLGEHGGDGTPVGFAAVGERDAVDHRHVARNHVCGNEIARARIATRRPVTRRAHRNTPPRPALSRSGSTAATAARTPGTRRSAASISPSSTR